MLVRCRVPFISAMAAAVLLLVSPGASQAIPISYSFTGEIPYAIGVSGLEVFGNTTFSGSVAFDTDTILPVGSDGAHAAQDASVSLSFSNGLWVTSTMSLEFISPWSGSTDLLDTRGPAFVSGGQITGFFPSPDDPFVGAPNPSNILFRGLAFFLPTADPFDALGDPLLGTGYFGQLDLRSDAAGGSFSLRSVEFLPEPPIPALLGVAMAACAILGTARRRQAAR